MTTEAKEAALEQVAWSADSIADSRQDRDAAVMSARAEGATTAEIALAAGMTRQGIAKIIARNLPKSLDN